MKEFCLISVFETTLRRNAVEPALCDLPSGLDECIINARTAFSAIPIWHAELGEIADQTERTGCTEN